MYKIEPITPKTLFSFDIVNLDSTTENFLLNYYLYYLLNHTEDCMAIISSVKYMTSFIYDTDVYGYIIGKLENKDSFICDHVSALTIAPSYRRFGFGAMLMKNLENNGDLYSAHFADLYVRCSNKPAIKFYERIGYAVYRRVIGYYTGPNEDALDMRKSLKRDVEKKLMQRGTDIYSYQLNN